MQIARIIALFLLLPPFSTQVLSAALTSNTTWSGEVVVEQDILVPKGVTLTISSGTTVRVAASETTKTDPEFLSPLTEIVVRGALRAEGTPGKPVTFLPQGKEKATWAGIIIDGGKAELRACIARGAETGIEVNRGSLVLKECVVTGNRYGLVMHGQDAVVRADATRVEENDYGVVQLEPHWRSHLLLQRSCKDEAALS